MYSTLFATALPYNAPISSMPIAELPVPSHDAAVGRLYDGCPDTSFELPGAMPDLRMGGTFETPLRATVAVTQGDALVGAALAFGAVSARVSNTEDGQYAEILLAWPHMRAWGQGQCDFLKERARVRCVEQYVQAAMALAQHLEFSAPGACVVLTFAGDWDEETHSLRRKLAARFVDRLFTGALVRH